MYDHLNDCMSRLFPKILITISLFFNSVMATAVRTHKIISYLDMKRWKNKKKSKNNRKMRNELKTAAQFMHSWSNDKRMNEFVEHIFSLLLLRSYRAFTLKLLPVDLNRLTHTVRCGACGVYDIIMGHYKVQVKWSWTAINSIIMLAILLSHWRSNCYCIA